jgi:hypothetical protein
MREMRIDHDARRLSYRLLLGIADADYFTKVQREFTGFRTCTSSAVSMRSVICGVSANILYLARCRKHQMRSVQPCDAMPGFGQHWIRLVTLKRSVD